MGQLALGQQMALEDDVDRLQVEFGGHVADRAIFVVEILGRLGALAVALDEMLEHLPMADEVVAEVHRHEAGELEEARIDLPAGARIEIGDGGDDVAARTRRAAAGSPRVLTAVGASRVSIGPPIMVSVFGRQGCLSALIRAAAA